MHRRWTVVLDMVTMVNMEANRRQCRHELIDPASLPAELCVNFASSENLPHRSSLLQQQQSDREEEAGTGDENQFAMIFSCLSDLVYEIKYIICSVSWVCVCISWQVVVGNSLKKAIMAITRDRERKMKRATSEERTGGTVLSDSQPLE